MLALLVGCGGGVGAEQWTADVCRALAPWRATIGQLNEQAQRELSRATSPAEAKAGLLALLGGAVAATRTALDALIDAGTPQVDGGEEIAARFVTSLRATADAYARAKQDILALSVEPAPSDGATFYDDVAGVLTRLTGEYAAAGVDTAKLESTELRAAFESARECR